MALQQVARRIHVVRGERVMLDADLAELYGVETKRLNEAVRRNPSRFPDDFMFQLTLEEAGALRSQFATSNIAGRGGRRSLPYAFTEQGVAMLSSVLNSERAIAVNILAMRAFVQLRRAQVHYAELRLWIEQLARRTDRHDKILKQILATLDALAEPAVPPRRALGFRPPTAPRVPSGRRRFDLS